MSNNGRTRGLAVLSKYRGELCGLAIISIMIFHYVGSYSSYAAQNEIAIGIGWKLFNQIVGSIGVEIFLFYSGFGLYFSMKRNSNVLSFYKKRLVRILIPYLLFVPAAVYLIDIHYQGLDMVQFVKDVTLVSFWTEGNRIYWYIGFILVLYILFPLFFVLIDRKGFGGFYILMIILMPALLLLGYTNSPAYENISLAVTRIPIFLIGVLWGKEAYEQKRWNIFHILVILSGIALRAFYVIDLIMKYRMKNENIAMLMKIIKIYSRYFVQWYVLGVIVILCIAFNYILPKGLSRVLCWFGNISLELYITHIAFRLMFKYQGLPIHLWWCYLGCMIVSLLFSLIIHHLSNWISKVIS